MATATPLILPCEIDQTEWPRFATLPAATQLQLIAAATYAINKECDRILGQSTQQQIYTPGRQDSFRLDQYPVQSVTSVRTDLQSVLSIANVDPTVQRAVVTFTTTGPPNQLVVTGIQLSATASGIVNNTPLLFSQNLTLTALATSINLLSGWQALVNLGGDITTGGWAFYSTSDLVIDMGGQQAKAPTGTSVNSPAGASLKMYVRDMNYGLAINDDSRRGRITLFESLPDGYRFPDRQFGGAGGLTSGFGTGGGFGTNMSGNNGSWGNDPRLGGVQVSYIAGWATADVPPDLKQDCIISAKFLYEATVNTGRFQSEGIGAYNYSLADLTGYPLPKNVCAQLSRYRRAEIF